MSVAVSILDEPLLGHCFPATLVPQILPLTQKEVAASVQTSNTTGPAVSRIIPNKAPSLDKTPDASTVSDLPLGGQDWLESTTETSASPTDTGPTLPLGGQEQLESNEFSPSLGPIERDDMQSQSPQAFCRGNCQL